MRELKRKLATSGEALDSTMTVESAVRREVELRLYLLVGDSGGMIVAPEALVEVLEEVRLRTNDVATAASPSERSPLSASSDIVSFRAGRSKSESLDRFSGSFVELHFQDLANRSGILRNDFNQHGLPKADKRKWHPYMQRMDGVMVLPDDAWDKFGWSEVNDGQTTLQAENSGPGTSWSPHPQATIIVVAGLCFFLIRTGWCRRKPVERRESVAAAVNVESNLSDIEEGTTLRRPPQAALLERSTEGGVAILLSARLNINSAERQRVVVAESALLTGGPDDAESVRPESGTHARDIEEVRSVVSPPSAGIGGLRGGDSEAHLPAVITTHSREDEVPREAPVSGTANPEALEDDAWQPHFPRCTLTAQEDESRSREETAGPASASTAGDLEQVGSGIQSHDVVLFERAKEEEEEGWVVVSPTLSALYPGSERAGEGAFVSRAYSLSFSNEPEELRPAASMASTSGGLARGVEVSKAGRRSTAVSDGIREEGPRWVTLPATLNSYARGFLAAAVAKSWPGPLHLRGQHEKFKQTTVTLTAGANAEGFEGVVAAFSAAGCAGCTGVEMGTKGGSGGQTTGAIPGGFEGGAAALVGAGFSVHRMVEEKGAVSMFTDADLDGVKEDSTKASGQERLSTEIPCKEYNHLLHNVGTSSNSLVEGKGPLFSPARARTTRCVSGGPPAGEGGKESRLGVEPEDTEEGMPLGGTRPIRYDAVETAQGGGMAQFLSGPLRFVVEDEESRPVAAAAAPSTATTTAGVFEEGAAALLAVGFSGGKGVEEETDLLAEEPGAKAGGVENLWLKTPHHGFGGAVDCILPSAGGAGPAAEWTIDGKGHKPSKKPARTFQCFAMEPVGVGGALEAIPEDAEQGAGAVSAELSAWLRKHLDAELAQKEKEQQQLEDTRLNGLTGLSRYAEVDWRGGHLKRLFVGNTAESSGQVAADFAEKALVTNGTEKFSFGPNLGHGFSGRVDEVSRPSLPGKFALKTIKEGTTSSALHCAIIEMKVLALLVLKPHDKVLGALAVDDTSPRMPILMRRADCDLGNAFGNDTFTLHDRLRLVMDVVEGAQHLHSLGIVHRDIKLGNVLVTNVGKPDCHGKVADFGFAREIGESCPGEVGTPGYMPYECLSSEPVEGAAAQDVFAVAVVVLLACLKKENRHPNLFSMPAFRAGNETTRMQHLQQGMDRDPECMAEAMRLEFLISRRTMETGGLDRWLSPDKLDPNLQFPEMVIGLLPSFLANGVDDREDMTSLHDLVSHLAECLSLAMKGWPWGLALLPLLVLAFGGTGAGAARVKQERKQGQQPQQMTQAQRECCSLLGEEGGHVPEKCLLAHEFACEPLRFAVNLDTAGEFDEDKEAKGAFQQQLELRQREGCRSEEWQRRCPPTSTMLLASTSAGRGCAAAGCVAVDGVAEAAAALAGDGADTAILRAVTRQEFRWLRKPTSNRKLRQRHNRFVKEERHFLQRLAATLTTGGQPDIETISRLVEEASSKGFVGKAIDNANEALAKHATEQKALAYVRSIPGKALSLLAQIVLDKKAAIKDKNRTIGALVTEVRRLKENADKATSSFAATKVNLEVRLAEAMTREEELAVVTEKDREIDALAARIRILEDDGDKAVSSLASAELQCEARLASEANIHEEELAASEARNRALEYMGRQQLETKEMEAQLGSCAEYMTDLESKAGRLATSVEAAAGQTCPEHENDDHGLPAGTTRATGDAHMGVRESLDRVEHAMVSVLAAAEEERDGHARTKGKLDSTVDAWTRKYDFLGDTFRDLMTELYLRYDEIDQRDESFRSCSSELGDLVAASNSVVKFIRGKTSYTMEEEKEELDDALNWAWATMPASMAIRKNLEQVRSITSSSVARLADERDGLQHQNDHFRQHINELLQRSSQQDDQLAVLEEQIDIEREYLASCEGGLASCEADFATAASSASKLAYQMHEGRFSFEGIDVTTHPPDASVIPGNGVPTPHQSFEKLWSSINHVRSRMASYTDYLEARCLDNRETETVRCFAERQRLQQQLLWSSCRGDILRWFRDTMKLGWTSSEDAGAHEVVPEEIEEAVAIGIGADSNGDADDSPLEADAVESAGYGAAVDDGEGADGRRAGAGSLDL
eukprot:g19338.t1